MDSKIMYDAIIDNTKLGADAMHLEELITMARALYASVSGRIVLAFMYRKYKNPADAHVGEARMRGAGCGDPSLWPTIPTVPAKKAKRQRISDPIEDRAVEVEPLTINTIEEYGALRRIPTRTRCPNSLIPLWSNIVKLHLRRILDAESEENRNRSVIKFLALPTIFLPTYRPFADIKMGLNDSSKQDVYKRPTRIFEGKTEDERFASYVERLAIDGRVKQATKAISNRSPAPRAPDDVVLEQLKLKVAMSDVEELPTEAHTNTSGRVSATIEGTLVLSATRKVSRDTSTGVDGWTRDLIREPMIFDPSIADDLGAFLTMVINGRITGLAMQLMRSSRIVAIPKDDGSVRPICVGNLFMKILGIAILERGKLKNCEAQYGIGKIGGAEKVAHLVRNEYDKLRTIIAIDSTNAFNLVSRKALQKYAERSNHDVFNYYIINYEKPNDLIFYKREGVEILQQERGVRQGDALSSYLFCLAMDNIYEQLMASPLQNMKMFMYMDDVTISCSSEQVPEIMLRMKEAMRDNGLVLNEEKSGTHSVDKSKTCSEPCVVLGAMINQHGSKYFTKMRKKIDDFFDMFSNISIHPQLLWSILRMCGGLKLKYYCSVNVPIMMETPAKYFDQKVVEAVKKIVGCEVAPIMLHDKLGGGIPKYADLYESLYRESHIQARQGQSVRVELLSNKLNTPNLRAQHLAQWLFFDPSYPGSLNHHEFRLALQIRLRCVPEVESVHACNCGMTWTSMEQQIEHGLVCQQYSNFTHTHRHNMVRDALCYTAGSFGIRTSSEPRYFTYAHGEARPDIVFHTGVKDIVTDVTVVSTGVDVGIEAERAAATKREIHTQAIEKTGATFIPFAMETLGHADKCCYELIQTISKHLRPYQQHRFRQKMLHAACTALAKARANTIEARKGREYGGSLW
jgi:hypothetical protein